MLTQESVLNALRTIQIPGQNKDFVSMGLIQDIDVQADRVSLRVAMVIPAGPIKKQIEDEVRAAVMSLGGGIKLVAIKMDQPQMQTQGKAPQNSIPGVKQIIAVSSGKGGVGKSTVAVNLATSLALEGKRVGLMDADVYGPNVPTMMGVTDQPKVMNDPVRGEIFYPPSAHGVKIMSMGFLVQGDQPLVWRGPMLHSVVNQFCHKVEWGDLDYLIVDMPPGTGDVQLSLAQVVPVTGTVLVTTPQEVSMQDVRKAYHMFEKVRVPVMGVVENMSYFKCDGCDKKHSLFGTDGGKMLAKKFGLELLAQLPIQPQVREGGDEGIPIVLRNPESEIAQAFRALARTVAQHATALSAKGAADVGASIEIGKFN